MPLTILIRGGGDLASGVAIRLVRAGWRVLVTELPQPLTVRRLVSFSETVYDGEFTLEGVQAKLAGDAAEAMDLMRNGLLAVLVDPPVEARFVIHPHVIIDGRMTKHPPDLQMDAASMVIGLGPGFNAGENCHAVIETMRGHFLGRVIWQGEAEADTGLPETVADHQADRVLRAPCDGRVVALAKIGDQVEQGQVLAEVGGQPVRAAFRGVLRGLIHEGLVVPQGLKIGDVDPRLDPRLCTLVSDKALAIGGGALEAILSNRDLRPLLWDK
ncbi:MAG: selenium-dependent molybdenum cofactor biosynthesis protein YqeB [Chloroflexi bacterium]|nr:selenium-dependent molybdenum cofactor biosynthesis protein YqeB [Chloroflexota bacterium]